MPTPIRIKRSAVPGKVPPQGALQYGELAYNINDAELYAVRNRAGIGSEVVRVAAGATVTNILYVTPDGKDTNTGLKLGDAKRTIGAAVTTATAGTVIKVAAGSYVENNPIILPEQVSVVGSSLREVSVTPQNQGDLFYVSNGNYIAEMSFVGAANTGAIVAFNPNKPIYINQSPYVQNCTNFIPNSIGMKVDGNHSIGPTKSMVLDSYTQYNAAGVGVSITNEGYAQLVSLFTICPNIAVYVATGAACDLTNSNSSFGNYGLVSDGVGPLKYTGLNHTLTEVNEDTFVVELDEPVFNVINAAYDNNTGVTTITTAISHNFSVGMGVTIAGLGFTCIGNPGAGIATYPSGNNGYVFNVKSVPAANQFVVNVGPSTTPGQVYLSGGTVSIKDTRPFDGQVVYFDTLYYTVSKIRVGSAGTGYLTAPTVTISAPPTDWGVTALAAAEVKNGSVVNIELISSGRGYITPPTITLSAPDVGINTATATLEVLPSYYSVVSSTPISAGLSTITVNENVPYVLGIGASIPFFKQSRILASGHSFEYIGSGTTINNALPAQGGVPIQENEVDMRNGGSVIYTSTDQTGNFRIGEGVVVNQTTGSISGIFYSKSLFSTLTPFILALGGD